MTDIWMDVDTAIAEAPVNIMPLIDDTDFKTIEAAVVYNAAGMALIWHFVTTAGVMTETAVTPTTAGVHDWTDQGTSGLYALEIPASAGTINNDTEGFGWFTGVATGVLPWRGPVIGFRAAALNNALIDGGDNLDTNVVQWLGTAAATPTTAGVPSVALTAIGLDAIVSTATGMVEIAKAVWDRVLTGATHNIATSAGRRLRGIQEFQGYEGGFIFIDTVNGTAGTIDYENGTVERPVSTLADAVTLSASLGYNRFFIINGSTITLASTFNNYVFDGHGWTLALGGQDIGGSHFHDATVSGIGTGSTTIDFTGCAMGTCTLNPFHMSDCGYNGTITFGAAGNYIVYSGHSAIAGATTPIFDTGAAIANVNFAMPDWHNGVEIQNLNAAGTDLFSISGIGQIIYAASSSGAVNQRGDWKVTNTGGVTITADDNTVGVADKTGYSLSATGLDLILVTSTFVAATIKGVWDRVISKANHNVAGSSGKVLRQAGDLIQIDGVVSDAGPTTTDFDTNLTGYGDGFFEDSSLLFANGSANGGISKPITGYTSVTGNFQFAAPDDWPVTPVDTDDFDILGIHVHPVSQIQSGLATEAKQDATDIVIAELTTQGDTNEGKIDIIDTNVDSVLVDTNELQTDWTNGGRLDVILDAILAMLDDPRAEPGQGAPAVNADMATKLDYIYKAWRNKSEQTATDYSLYDDAGTTIDQKATVSDDTTTATKNEIVTGP